MKQYLQHSYDSPPELNTQYFFVCEHCGEVEERRYLNEYKGQELHSDCVELVKEKEEVEMIRWWEKMDENTVRSNFNIELYYELKDKLNEVKR